MKANEIKNAKELRPCLVRTQDGEKKALFHRWEYRVGSIGPDDGPVTGNAECFGIIELEGGKIVRRYPGQITFADDMVRRVWDELADTVAEGAEYA